MSKQPERIRSIENLTKDSERIVQVLRDEPDYAAAIIGASYLDACLGNLLSAFLLDSKVTTKMLAPDRGALGSLAARADLAYVLGLVPKALYQDLVAIGAIRNRFAHTHLDLTFKDEEIASLAGNLQYCPGQPGKGTVVPAVSDPRARFILSLIRIADSLVGIISGTARRLEAEQ